jgi:hypothetical protein
MGHAIEQLYGSNLGCGEDTPLFDAAKSTAALDQQMLTWECSLPSSLSLIGSDEIRANEHVNETSFLVKRFRVILTMRRHSILILIHRPLLVQLLLQEPSNDELTRSSHSLRALKKIVPRSAKAGLASAIESVSIMHSCFLEDNGQNRILLGAWWYLLYYGKFFAFSAKPMLLALTIRSSIYGGSLYSCWTHCSL